MKTQLWSENHNTDNCTPQAATSHAVVLNILGKISFEYLV